ncbi:fatty-acid-binding protein 1 [Quercus suber]|uniref:Fatty-acid-binding protein 1 n=1 Tax=Quercus suber TaxID=58331 RepID=A0AAW0KSI0_QUESU
MGRSSTPLRISMPFRHFLSNSSFWQPPKPNRKLPHTKPTTTASTFLAASAVATTAGAAAIAILVESKTGVPFSSVLDDSKPLLGIGLRKKSVLGLKNIDVYAFGVYADDNDLKKFLSKKYGKLSNPEFKENNELNEYLIENDICMTVRLQIVYSKLSIRSVCSAFEESVGSILQKFGGSDNKDLLQRFTSQFKDEYKIPRGSLIDLSRERGHVLCTKSKIFKEKYENHPEVLRTEIELKRLQDELEYYQNWVKEFTWRLHEGFWVRFKAIWWLKVM